MSLIFNTQQHARLPHLTADYWQRANRHLVTKMLRELCHEKILEPREVTEGNYQIILDDCHYYFAATPFALDHLEIDASSVRKYQQQQQQPLDALALLLELRPKLEIPEDKVPLYLEELSSTLYSLAFKYCHHRLNAQALTEATYQQVESSMLEGHPVFIANSGRIGFDCADHQYYAPESATPVALGWIAVHRDRAVFSCDVSLCYHSYLQQELGADLYLQFLAVLRQGGADPEHYYLMPVHPWQWLHKITLAFAADIASGHLVWLGYGIDRYQAQQSIRTFYNLTHPEKSYVKTALSVLNMGFMRGLDPKSMLTTPQVNAYLHTLITQDPLFQQTGFRILREHAAIGYFDPYFTHSTPKDSPHKKMLSALWRESPSALIAPGQRLMTMASLLHIDQEGQAVVAALIRRSGQSAAHWFSRYLDCYFTPILHAFFCYDLVFMPHGENLIMVLEDHLPKHMFMKDIGEEVAFLNSDHPLPDAINFLHVCVADEMKINYILLDLFDCFFRYLVPILQQHAGLPEQSCWSLVGQCITDYQRRHPQWGKKYRQFDLFKPQFVRTCLNRLQLANNTQMIDLDDREKNLRFSGFLDNPLFSLK